MSERLLINARVSIHYPRAYLLPSAFRIRRVADICIDVFGADERWCKLDRDRNRHRVSRGRDRCARRGYSALAARQNSRSTRCDRLADRRSIIIGDVQIGGRTIVNQVACAISCKRAVKEKMLLSLIGACIGKRKGLRQTTTGRRTSDNAVRRLYIDFPAGERSDVRNGVSFRRMVCAIRNRQPPPTRGDIEAGKGIGKIVLGATCVGREIFAVVDRIGLLTRNEVGITKTGCNCPDISQRVAVERVVIAGEIWRAKNTPGSARPPRSLADSIEQVRRGNHVALRIHIRQPGN